MDRQDRRVGKLKHLVVNRVALVDAGANQHSMIELYKRAPETSTISQDSQPSSKSMNPSGGNITITNAPLTKEQSPC